MKLTCYFNHSIQIIYRCDLSSKQWMYVYGNTNHFQRCHPPCANSERIELLNKYFSQYEQSKIHAKYIEKRKSVRFRCFNTHENRWKSISYKCGTMTLTKYQWFKLHSCFQPIVTTTTTELPRKFIVRDKVCLKKRKALGIIFIMSIKIVNICLSIYELIFC